MLFRSRMLAGFKTLRQLRKSWYMFFFQLDGVAERLFRKDDFAALRKLLREVAARPGAFTAAERDGAACVLPRSKFLGDPGRVILSVSTEGADPER